MVEFVGDVKEPLGESAEFALSFNPQLRVE
jgi:hypothetical protein